jgi:hypothetical protein
MIRRREHNQTARALALAAVVLLLLTGCSLIPTGIVREVFFYSLNLPDGSGDGDFSLSYRDDGYTFVMSCGVGGMLLTRDQATALTGTISFVMELDGTALEPDGPIGVRRLGFLGLNGWHAVQYFSVDDLPVGGHTLFGKTVFSEGPPRTNTVNLTVQ